MMMHLVARRYSHFRALTPPSGGLIHSADLILIWFLSANIIYDTSMKLEWYTVWIQAEVKPLLCRFDTQCCWSFSSLLHCSIASDCCCYPEVCYSADNINLILLLCTLASCLHPERFDSCWDKTAPRALLQVSRDLIHWLLIHLLLVTVL